MGIVAMAVDSRCLIGKPSEICINFAWRMLPYCIASARSKLAWAVASMSSRTLPEM